MPGKKLAALLLTVALLTSGCTRSGGNGTYKSGPELPEAEAVTEQPIRGELRGSELRQFTLYEATEEGTGFVLTERMISVPTGESGASEILRVLLERYGSTQMYLRGLEESNGIITVDISGDAYLPEEQRLYSLAVAISDTLLSLSDIRAVNVLCNGTAISVRGMPLGVQTQLISNPAVSYAQYNVEREYISENDTGLYERDVLVYLPVAAQTLLLPSLRHMRFTYATEDISELLKQLSVLSPDDPDIEGLCTEEIPNPVGSTVFVTEDGRRGLELVLDAFPSDEDVTAGIVLTITSILPDIDCLRILVGNVPVTLERSGRVGGDDLLTRDDFCDRVGAAATLYVPNVELGRLSARTVLTTGRRADSPNRLLSLLLPELRKTLLPELSETDIPGVSLIGSVARVDLSAELYRTAQPLSDTAERLLIYSMIDTLCTLRGISSVRFTVEGDSIETLSGGLYLRSTLMDDPGIRTAISNTTPTEDE